MEGKHRIIPQSHPWLIIRDPKDGEWKISYSISKQECVPVRISPFMQNKSICAYSDGWLVLRDCKSNDCHLFNPISEKSFQLPSLSNADRMACLLCPLSGGSNFRVLFIDCRIKTPTTTIWFCQLGDDKFSRKEVRTMSWVQPIFFQGQVYCFVSRDKPLYVIKFKGSDLDITPVKEKTAVIQFDPGVVRVGTFLIECFGEILLVYKMYFGCRWTPDVSGFRIFRFDFSSKEWVELNNIGGWTIFLSYRRGMSCCAKELGVESNSIYFVERDERCLRVFNLEDQSFSMTLPCSTIKDGSILDWIMDFSGPESSSSVTNILT